MADAEQRGGLFPDVERASDGARRYPTALYDYLWRSARAEAGRVRELLEAWFARYPAKHRGQLAREFRRSKEEHFLGAFFGLYVHAMCSCLGCRLDVHPSIPGTTRTPDLLLHEEAGDAYLEAAVATEPRDEQLRGAARVDLLLDGLRKIDSPRFILHVARRGRPPRGQPSTRKLVDEVKRWLRTLDRYPAARDNAVGPALECVLEKGADGKPTSWLVVRASLRRPAAAGGALGSISAGCSIPISLPDAIRQSLNDKASRYRRFDLPYVVAMNVRLQLPSLDHELCEGALFGEVVVAPPSTPGVPTREIRKRNGFWLGPAGQRVAENTRVSAVLLVGNLTPWSIAHSHQQAVLYLNPWAERPYKGQLARLSRGRFDQSMGRVSYDAGVHPREIFGLSDRWPED